MGANAGVDPIQRRSADRGALARRPDASATRIRDEIAEQAKVTVAVVITDTFGRAGAGSTNIAIGIPACRAQAVRSAA